MADMQGRERRTSSGGTGVHRRGSDLGTGPVGKAGGYSGRTGSTGTGGNGIHGSSGGGSRPSGGGNRVPQGGGNRAGGGGNPLVLIIILAVILMGGGGGLTALLGGGDSPDTASSSYNTSSYGNTGSYYSGNGNSSLYGNYSSGNGYDLSQNAASPYSSGGSSYSSYSSAAEGQGSYGVSSILSGLMASLGSSSDNSLTGTYTGWEGGSNTGSLDTSVSPLSSGKLTQLIGNGKDTVTIMVYMCGTDLEAKSSMATSDIVEMTKASLSDKVNLILYTGGCTKWNNNIISSKTNQIYMVKDGGLRCLVQDDGDLSMTDPRTLTRFIKWCRNNYPANRNELILWDHGGGSVSGFGYDQKHSRAGTMSLPQIKSAVTDSGVTFDFIGFDACLMATAETALALSGSADYLLASEETEPGTGWYYTNWLTSLSKNTSIPTTELGKQIIDDFVDMSARQARGQSTTLSLVDLSELKETFPDSFSSFAEGINELLDSNHYTTIATARKNTREFARSTHINQYDLVHLAKNLGTEEGKDLADVVLGAVKYNRTSSDMTNSYGLAVYFPSQNKYTDTMTATYKALDLSSSYSNSFRKIAAVQEAGQAVSGGSHSLSDLLGNASGSSGSSLFDMYGGSIFGGNSSGNSMTDILGYLLSGRSINDSYSSDFLEESGYSGSNLAEMLEGNVFNGDSLKFTYDSGKYTLALSAPQWGLVDHLERNVFYDDGEGYIDLGLDTVYSVSEDGVLTAAADRYWISIDEHPVAFYHVSTTKSDEGNTIIGRVPCYLNGDRANLILVFDPENPYGYVAGASFDYQNSETDTIAKAITALSDGDVIDFVCDYYTYDQEFDGNYYLGEQMIVDGDPEITDTWIGDDPAFVSYLFTDIYGQEYWTDPVWLD